MECLNEKKQKQNQKNPKTLTTVSIKKKDRASNLIDIILPKISKKTHDLVAIFLKKNTLKKIMPLHLWH